MLPHLADEERAEQVCGLEAMAQVQAWRAEFQPDRLVAYAMSPTRTTGQVIHAEGAAFRSRRQWFRISFTCQVTPNHLKVMSFAFRLGDPIPRAEWEAHGLPALH